MKVREKAEEAEAIQWFPGVKIEGVEEVAITAHFSADGASYYVSGMGVQPMKWIPVDGNGMEFPFAFWHVEAGKKQPITVEDLLYERYAKASGWKKDAKRYARLIRPYGEGLVHEGEWVVRSVLGALHVYNDEDFRKKFTAIPETVAS
jgi:hypothetical protein